MCPPKISPKIAANQNGQCAKNRVVPFSPEGMRPPPNIYTYTHKNIYI